MHLALLSAPPLQFPVTDYKKELPKLTKMTREEVVAYVRPGDSGSNRTGAHTAKAAVPKSKAAAPKAKAAVPKASAKYRGVCVCVCWHIQHGLRLHCGTHTQHTHIVEPITYFPVTKYFPGA
jgi:hypothetical protein